MSKSHDRPDVRVDLDEVETQLLGLGARLLDGDDAELVAFGIHEPDRAQADLVVETHALGVAEVAPVVYYGDRSTS